jgi:Lon protease-like protein
MTDHPMFPLGTVYVPGDVVSLRVFEDRYVTMVRDVLSDDDDHMQFGTVLIDKGSEVGGNDKRRDVGVNVRLHSCAISESGGYVLAGVATHRLFVQTWKSDAPYPVAEVSFDEPDKSPSVSPSQVSVVAQQVRSVLHLMLENASERMSATGDDGDTLGRFLPPDLVSALGRAAAGSLESHECDAAAWVIVRCLPCGPFDRYSLLAAPTLEDRLRQVENVVAHLREMVEFHRL